MALGRGKEPTPAPKAKSWVAPRPQPQPRAQVSLSGAEDRFEKGLARRWEQAWSRARAADR
jgi:hypothetical protein